MHELSNPVQAYAWGSTTAIAELLGEPVPTPQPQAELWMGAHPSAPSRLADGGESLLECIESDPVRWLGRQVAEVFGARLPFLLKVLAADSPLSLQAHPDPERARSGYAAEQARGVPLDAPQRNYRDQHHKPELICALTPFEALCGFRTTRDCVRLLGALDVAELAWPLELLADGAGLRAVVELLLTSPPDGLVGAVGTACRRCAGEDPAYRWAAELADRYPGDVGVAISLLLNLIQLRPGQAIYLPAGRLHAYLRGTGIEVMANSDNVLRGGLTPKHVDVPELLAVLDFDATPVPILAGVPGAAGEAVYPTPAPEFRLSRIVVRAGRSELVEADGPQILLTVEGWASLTDGESTLPLPRGRSAFIEGSSDGVRLSGDAVLFRVTTGRLDPHDAA